MGLGRDLGECANFDHAKFCASDIALHPVLTTTLRTAPLRTATIPAHQLSLSSQAACMQRTFSGAVTLHSNSNAAQLQQRGQPTAAST